MVSSLLFVVVYISVMIDVISASSVSDFFWVSRSPRSCPVVCSISFFRLLLRVRAPLLAVGEGYDGLLIVTLAGRFVLLLKRSTPLLLRIFIIRYI
jgi:hypothetical protein